MQVVSLSCFRFAGPMACSWAFSQMAWSRWPLSRLPDLGFYKMFGTGTGEGFTPVPNLGVYALLTSWPSLSVAQDRIANSPVFRNYRNHASEAFTVHLTPTGSRGQWDGREPFQPGPEDVTPSGPVAFMTRATVKLRHVRDFWSTVPAISNSIARHPDMLFKIGMGEIPWVHQVTFSIWPSLSTMRAFAYGQSDHAKGVAKVRAGDWFKEELFARFVVLARDGTWHGRDPLANYLPPVAPVAPLAAREAARALEPALKERLT